MPYTVMLLRSSRFLGGIERQELDHALRLREAGWRPYLLCFLRSQGEHPLAVAAAQQGLDAETVHDPGVLSWQPWRRLRAAVAQIQPDLLHTLDYRTDVWAAWLAGPTLPWLAESHGHTRESVGMAVWNRLDLWALRRSTGVVAVSTAWETMLAAGLSGRRGGKRQRSLSLHVVGNSTAILPDSAPVEPQDFAAVPPGRGPHLLYAGRLAPEKGLDILLRAWPEIRASFPDACLWVLGAPAARGGYRRTLAPLLRQPGITALGHQPTIRPWLLAVDAVVAPSRQETWGMTVFEALALGKPVLATRVGGLPDLCRLSGTLSGASAPHAHLVAPESPAAIAAGLRLVLRPEFPRGPELGDAYRNQPVFDPARRFRLLFDLYERMI